MKTFDSILKHSSPTKIQKIKAWWSKNGYKVMRVVFFPIWAIAWCLEKAKDKQYKSMVWSEEKAKKVLDRNLPRVCDVYDGEISFNTEWPIWASWNKKVMRKDRKWANKFRSKLNEYLVDTYEVDSFIKTIEDDYGYKWVLFKKDEMIE